MIYVNGKHVKLPTFSHYIKFAMVTQFQVCSTQHTIGSVSETLNMMVAILATDLN